MAKEGLWKQGWEDEKLCYLLDGVVTGMTWKSLGGAVVEE